MSKLYTIRFRTDDLASVIAAVQQTNGELISLTMGDESPAPETPAKTTRNGDPDVVARRNASRAKTVESLKAKIVDQIVTVLKDRPALTIDQVAHAMNALGHKNLHGNEWAVNTIAPYYSLATLAVKGIGSEAEGQQGGRPGRPQSTPPGIVSTTARIVR